MKFIKQVSIVSVLSVVSFFSIAQPVSIDWSGTPYFGPGLPLFSFDNIDNVEVFEFDGDVESATHIALFDSDPLLSTDYGFIPFDISPNDWYIKTTTSPLVHDGSFNLTSGTISLSAVSNFLGVLADPLLDLNIEQTEITASDLLFTGSIANVSSTLDILGMASNPQNWTFTLSQGYLDVPADGGGNERTLAGNAMLSFELVEIPEPASILLFVSGLIGLSVAGRKKLK
ncbi:PEP-CTERM sorting domain-containing protein [Catenovulum sediminis]|uniref:PEP-CTERM sorting domain-containing protein n=1 Tax=Catenovulum sediminis TaxID=1740262 RepID=UPI00117D9715|nr:PEP-CTERM sorting domain-containing protein [Catenovulum sediminis]